MRESTKSAETINAKELGTMEYFVVANSFPAPIMSDASYFFVWAKDPQDALRRLHLEYGHPCGLYSARVYDDANQYHKSPARYVAQYLIGQAIFGAPFSEYQVPEFGESALRMVLDEMERVYGNRYGRDSDPFSGFGCNDGFVMPDGALGPDIAYRAYDWGDCDCGTEECQGKCDWSKPNLAFDGVEFRWYKHARRGLSCNKQMTPDEWAKWLQKALFYLRDQDVKL